MGRLTTLGKLTHEDLMQNPAWAAVGDFAEDVDASLEAVQLDADGRVPTNLEEVWCLCQTIFADGSRHLGVAMCRADCGDGPLLWSVWNGSRDVPLYVPPAPAIVLEKAGPPVFAKEFSRKEFAVFPMIITANVRFSCQPEVRMVRIDASGIIGYKDKR